MHLLSVLVGLPNRVLDLILTHPFRKHVLAAALDRPVTFGGVTGATAAANLGARPAQRFNASMA
jgi:hypothetical protein